MDGLLAVEDGLHPQSTKAGHLFLSPMSQTTCGLRPCHSPLPCFHLVDDEITGIDKLIDRKVFRSFVVVVVPARFFNYAEVSIDRKHDQLWMIHSLRKTE